MTTDYWVNKLMFDLPNNGGKGTWMNREARKAFIDRYPLPDEIRTALMEDDFATIQPLANAYLLRNFLLMCGLNDAQSMHVLHDLHDGSDVKGVQEGFVKGSQMPGREVANG